MYSAALCRGLIEAWSGCACPSSPRFRIPRLYAAASLKRLSFWAGRETQIYVFRGSMPRPH